MAQTLKKRRSKRTVWHDPAAPRKEGLIPIPGYTRRDGSKVPPHTQVYPAPKGYNAKTGFELYGSGGKKTEKSHPHDPQHSHKWVKVVNGRRDAKPEGWQCLMPGCPVGYVSQDNLTPEGKVIRDTILIKQHAKKAQAPRNKA